MKRSLLPCLLALVFLAAPARAQDAATPGTDAADSTVFLVTSHHCDLAKLDALVAQDRERALPILQALADDGALAVAGEAVHLWGDEYNLLTWIGASDMTSAVEAWQEMVARYDEAHPEDNLYAETCSKHRDGFYRRNMWMQADPLPTGGASPPTLAVSYFTCDYANLGDIIEQYRERSVPLVEALIDEGAMISEGLYTHMWGDEWNLAISRSAATLPALLEALGTFSERYEAEHGSQPQALVEEHCTSHRDNIYSIMMSTQ